MGRTESSQYITNSDEISCPRCKTTKYRNPNLKLMVNTCGHSLCESCVELLFVKGSGQCPECQTALRRANFRFQVFENSYVDKEVNVRKEVLKTYNKKEDDFATLRDFNDYLEEIETIVFNLVNNVDADATRDRMAAYKKDNAELIKKNQNKKSQDELLIEELLDEERELQALRRNESSMIEEKNKIINEKKRQKEKLVDELMFSDLPAHQILDAHSHEQKWLEQSAQQDAEMREAQERQRRGPTLFSTGIQLGKSSNFMSIPKPEDMSEQYEYREVQLEPIGPSVPAVAEFEEEGYLLHVRTVEPQEQAGGFLPIYPCSRALREAFCGLFFDRRDDLHQQQPSFAEENEEEKPTSDAGAAGYNDDDE